MSDDPEEKSSFILIRFKEIGSAQCLVEYRDVTPEQLLLATSLLDLYAKNEFVAKQQQLMTKQRLVVPEKGILKPN